MIFYLQSLVSHFPSEKKAVKQSNSFLKGIIFQIQDWWIINIYSNENVGNI